MNQLWSIEDIKLGGGDEEPVVLAVIPFFGLQAEGETLVRTRMASHFKSKAAEAVRLVGDLGEEAFRWDWWKEDERIQLDQRVKRQKQVDAEIAAGTRRA